MLDGRRPPGRLFYVLLSVLLLTAVSQAQAPAMTTIGDVVYRADGTPAAGTLLISWPAFTTADGKPVAAGTKSVMLGAQGTLSVALAPNGSLVAGGSADGRLFVWNAADGKVVGQPLAHSGSVNGVAA